MQLTLKAGKFRMACIILTPDDKEAAATMSRIEIVAPALEPWIGLIHVRPIPGKSPFGPEVKGAYVQMVALATSADEFLELVREDLSLDNLVVVDSEDVGTV